jgi:hypothetical protein
MNTLFTHARHAAAVTVFSFAAFSAPAQSDTERYQKLEAELLALRQQMGAMQDQHARELAELKAMLLKQPVVTTTVVVAQAPAPAAVAPPSLYESLKQTAGTMVPQTVAGKGADLDVSVVLDMNAYHDTGKEGVGHLKEHMSGFGHHHEGAEEGHHHGFEDGFNLRHVELGFSAEVDPYFRAWTVVAVDEDGAELEEAVLQTTSLPGGLTLSGGKIKSGIGRINRQHSHNWDFLDQPLVYDAFFGEHGLADTGAQLTWLAPTPFYLLLGAEAFDGDNEKSFAVDDSGLQQEHAAPRLYTAFLKAGPDLGPNHALQVGLSVLSGRHQVSEVDEEEGSAGADGYSRIYGADAVYKYDAKRAHGYGDVIVQAEYFYRDQDLDHLTGGWQGLAPWSHQQDGYYAQGLYGFLPRWRAGLRWDQVGLTNEVEDPETASASCDSSYRLASVCDWKLSEFSLLRLQAGRGWYATDEGREAAWEFALQWQITFGKHAAHDF